MLNKINPITLHFFKHNVLFSHKYQIIINTEKPKKLRSNQQLKKLKIKSDSSTNWKHQNSSHLQS
jgi:hypothetical protein